MGDHAINAPEKAPLGKERQAYLAGALWAIDELMTVRLGQLGTASAPGGTTRRTQIRTLVMHYLTADDTPTPTALQARITKRDIDVRLDEISRTLGDLFSEGLVAPTQPGPGEDRRRKHFTLTDEGRRAAAEAEA
ncbi:hypothetical protein [Gordonia alkanivorans]|uniref:hypothetical protein n=1 Tax=Gordonia alkanivorans TaxID=84096 RepID=UPI001F4E5E08|nr:hypothetical protein [Gordonia alkanivorans]